MLLIPAFAQSLSLSAHAQGFEVCPVSVNKHGTVDKPVGLDAICICLKLLVSGILFQLRVVSWLSSTTQAIFSCRERLKQGKSPH